MAKFLLSTGKSTNKIEYYIVDLFRIYLQVYPGDIPNVSGFGFNFVMDNVMKADLERELKSRINTLVSLIQERFEGNGVTITVDAISIINESLANVVISVNDVSSGDIEVNLYN